MTDTQTLAYQQALEGAPEAIDPYGGIPLPTDLPEHTGFAPVQANDKFDFTRDPEDSVSYRDRSLLSHGFSQAKGSVWKGFGQTLGVMEDQFGFETDIDKQMLEWSKTNLNDATVSTNGLLEDVVYTAGQVGLPIAAVGAAALLAPLVGVTAAVGGTLAGLGVGYGMTAGDYFGKLEAEDENFDPALADVGIATALTLPEMIPISKGLKILAPFAESVARAGTSTAAKAGMDVSKIKQYAGNIVETSVEQGIIEGSQDFAGSIAAAIRTDSELDSQKIETLAVGAAYEGLIAGILGVPLGGLGTYQQNVLAERVKQDAGFQPSVGVDLRGEDGELSLDFRQLTPVEGAPKQPGFFSLGSSVLLGNSTSKYRKILHWSPKAQALLDNFNTPFNRKRVGKYTVNEKSRALEGQMQTLAREFNKASKQDRFDAWDAKANNEQLDTPASKALWEILNVKIPELVKEHSNGEIDTSTGLFVETDYLPLHNDLSWKKMYDTEGLVAAAVADMTKNGKTQEQINSTVAALKTQLESYGRTGNNMSYALDKNADKYYDKVLKAAREAKEGKKSIGKKARARIKNQLRREMVQDKRESPLTLNRSLKNLSQNFLNQYRKDADPRSALNSHIRMVAEHLAMVNTFGVDNQLFDDAVIDIAMDAIDNGVDFDPSIVDSLYDILRTQQRIHLRPLKRPGVRNAQNTTRAIANTILLGLSALVSIPESLVVFMNTGGKASLQGLLQTVLRGMGSKEAGLASEQLGYTINTAIDHGINRTGEESYEVGTFENGFIRWTGLPYLQHFLTVWAARSFDVNVKEMLMSLDGDISETERASTLRKLAEAKIDVDKATDWMRGGFSEDSQYFKEDYVPSIINLTQDTIVDPHPIDKPLWMNDERFLLITQLKGFMTVFTNRVMGSWAQKIKTYPEGNRLLATKVAPYLAMYIAAQIAMQAVRETLKSGNLDDWDEQEIEERIFNAFGYVGGAAYFVDVVNSVRYRSDPLAAVAGPVPAKSLNVLKAMNDPENAVDNVIKQLFPNVPFKNIMLEALDIE